MGEIERQDEDAGSNEDCKDDMRGTPPLPPVLVVLVVARRSGFEHPPVAEHG